MVARRSNHRMALAIGGNGAREYEGVSSWTASSDCQRRGASGVFSTGCQLHRTHGRRASCAINAANASVDASSTITLTGNFAMSTALLPVPTKAITIDTAGFTLGGPPGPNNIGAPQFRNLNGGNITLLGNYVGGTGTAGANSTGGYGLFAIGTGGTPVIVNNGSISGGVGYSVNGRGGANRVQNVAIINNGTAMAGKL